MNEFSSHTPYTSSGGQAALLRALPPEPRAAAACWRGLTAHYRATPGLPAGRDEDKQTRWVADILDLLRRRSGRPLTEPRDLTERFVGCCRDDALLLVATLREHGAPARVRIGWAPYLNPGFVHDHVVAEWHDGLRWVRGDPEMDPAAFPFDTMDLLAGTFRGDDGRCAGAARRGGPGLRHRGRPGLAQAHGPSELRVPEAVNTHDFQGERRLTRLRR